MANLEVDIKYCADCFAPVELWVEQCPWCMCKKFTLEDDQLLVDEDE